MSYQFLPTLQVQRDLLDLPCGMERFDAYLKVMLDAERKKTVLPLQNFNPMSKDHIKELLDLLLKLRADDLLKENLVEFSRQFKTEFDLKVSWVVIDDVAGGWTNGFYMKWQRLFDNPFASRPMKPEFMILWWFASMPVAPDELNFQIKEQLFLMHHLLTKGNFQNLEEWLKFEAQMKAFSGRSLDKEFVINPKYQPYLKEKHPPVLIPLLYGDEAAEQLGYEKTDYLKTL